MRRILGLGWEALLLELALYRSLARWIARRPDVPKGATPVGYAQLAGPMLWLWIFGSATEVVVIELVLRQVEAGWAEAIRLPLLVLGIWGVLWMLGLMASYRVRPHLLDDTVLHVRSGARTWVAVPRSSIVAVRPTEHELSGIVRSVHHDEGLLLVGVSSRTNVELRLGGSTRLQTSKGEVVADRVGLWVDDPRAVVAMIGVEAGPSVTLM